MKLLVTGAAGFIGYHLCKKLVALGHHVIGLDNINDYYKVRLKYDRLKDLGIAEDKAAVWNEIAESHASPNFQFIRLNVEDREKLPRLFERLGIEKVIHLAAQAGVRYSLENPEVYIDSNIVGFLNILECCRHFKVSHLVYASSSSVYGENKKVPFCEDDRVDHPISLYAATKKSNELMAYTYSHLYRIPISGLRFFTVYGPWGRPDMAPMLFAKAILAGEAIKVFNHGEMSRDFTFVNDIVEGIIITLNNSPAKESATPYNQLFNLGNGNPVSLMQFIETLEKRLGRIAIKKLLPMQPGDVPQTWSNTESLNKLGYKSTTSIDEGVEKFVEWYRVYYNLI